MQATTPTLAFNLELCGRFGPLPLEFDGRSDPPYRPFDRGATDTWNMSHSAGSSTTCRSPR